MRLLPVQKFTIHGSSMFPALKPDQDVLCFNWAYIFSKPKIGDIVVIKKNGQDMVKRIQMYHGRGIFVTGDNKQVCRCCGKKESTDSRTFGPIEKQEIVGKVILVVR